MRSILLRALAYVGAERPAGGPAPAASLPVSGADPVRPPSKPAAAPRRLAGARLAKFLSYYRPHIGLLLADLGCAILISATTLAFPICANIVVKRLTAAHDPAGLMPQIYAMGALMLGLLALQALATMFVDYQGHVMGAKMESALRKELFEHYQALSFGFYDAQRVGQLMSRISKIGR